MTVKSFWDSCKHNYAHLRDNWIMKKNSERKLYFKPIFEMLNLDNKTVIDYGCGGGHIGVYLFNNYKINKYIGLDIAERSLIFSKRNLEKYNAEFHYVPIEFKNLNADVFITIACMQHFPDEVYLISFLENLNRSGIKQIMLHLRYGDSTKFNNAYDTCLNMGEACKTNHEFIKNYLTNYKLIHTDEKHINTNSVIYVYEL